MPILPKEAMGLRLRFRSSVWVGLTILVLQLATSDSVNAGPRLIRWMLVASAAGVISLNTGCANLLNDLSILAANPVTDADRRLLRSKMYDRGLAIHPLVRINYLPQIHGDPVGYFQVARLPLTEINWEQIKSVDFSADETVRYQFAILELYKKYRPKIVYTEGVLAAKVTAQALTDPVPLVATPTSPPQSTSRPAPSQEQLDRATDHWGEVIMEEFSDDPANLSDDQRVVIYLYQASQLAKLKGYIGELRKAEPPIDRSQVLDAMANHHFYPQIGHEVTEVRETETICTILADRKAHPSTAPVWLIFGAGHLFEDYSCGNLQIRRIEISAPIKTHLWFLRKGRPEVFR